MLPEVTWRPTPVSELPSWEDAKRICIDLETHDPLLKSLGPGVRRGGYVCGIAFKIEDGEEHYLPIRHSEDNLPEEHVWSYLRDQAARFRGLLLGANLSYDLDYLWEKGVVFPKIGGYRDIQVTEPLLDELQDSYSLESIATRHGIPGKDVGNLEQALKGYGASKAGGMHLLPARFVAAYAIQDVRLPLIIHRRQERMIEEQKLERVHELECKLIPVLLKMRRRGVLIDQKKLQWIEDWSIVQQREALRRVEQETGFSLNLDDVNKAGAMARVLESVGVTVPTTKTGKPSVDKDLLEKLEHPVGKLLHRARRMDKLRGTFVNSIRRHMCNGRVHGTFHQTRKSNDDEDSEGARYGRLSSTDPNLQQQPARDPEIGPMWRSIYLPEPGMLWAANDYSQQEPRMVVHFAELMGLTKAKEAADRYRNDPKTDNHTIMAQLIAGQGADWEPPKKDRSDAKIIFLGLCYGMGGAKLARSLKLPTEWIFSKRQQKMIEIAGPEAQTIFNKFNAGVPFVRELADLAEARAGVRGFVTTLLGRRCRFPRKADGSGYDWLHKALNRIIQGSSADQTKLAVLKIDEAGHYLQLQVHDEVDLSVKDEAEAQSAADIMRTCLPINVPSKVDVEIGESWGDSM